MKITLKQSGGLAGRRLTRQLNTEELGSDRQEVEALAQIVTAQPDIRAAQHPDGIASTLLIEGDDRVHEARATDGNATPEFIRLAAEVRRRGKAGL
jgi:hypothetical protein